VLLQLGISVLFSSSFSSAGAAFAVPVQTAPVATANPIRGERSRAKHIAAVNPSYGSQRSNRPAFWTSRKDLY
jgi:hypothetical protein